MREPISAGAWAKLLEGCALSLVDHGADVAAVLAALLAKSRWRTLLEHSGGRALSDSDVERLCVLAALHDLGKANSGFWARQFPGTPMVGHTNETAALFRAPLSACPPVEALMALQTQWGAVDHFRAVMAHHGLPLTAYGESDQADAIRQKVGFWKSANGYDPIAELAALIDNVRARYPRAFAPTTPLPNDPSFVALVGGLVTLADWLGSDVGRFPVAGPHGAARDVGREEEAEAAVAERGLLPCAHQPVDFETAFGFPPRGVQLAAARLDLGPIALIEAETGSGKTEAALWRWLALRREGLVDGLYFALPTRAAAVQLHTRVNRLLGRVFAGKVQATLAVPGYIRAGDTEGDRPLPGFDVVWPDEALDESRWAAEHPKRYLSARVAVGTIDQALLAGLQVRHAHFRATMLARSLLVVDEVHSSDSFMTEVLRGLLRNHVRLGGQALLLSATLGAEQRVRLLNPVGESEPPTFEEAASAPYPAVSGCNSVPAAAARTGMEKRVGWQTLPIMADAQAIAGEAVRAARQGASVLVVRNSVRGAVAVAQAVETLAPELAFRVNGVATVHHSRFSPSDRRLLDAAIQQAFGKGRDARGRILVGTQTLEQSLDLDADYLLTDLAPVDVLLQRIGRLHRHARDDRGAWARAKAMVLVPHDRDLSLLLKRRARERHGLGPMGRDGTQGTYWDLVAIEGTWRLIEANREILIPRDNRRLVEEALHPVRMSALLAERGPAWIRHGFEQQGIAIADRGTARRYALDIGIRFRDLAFPVDTVVTTRLGARDRLVEFARPLVGPFGLPVERLTIPEWMATGVPAEAAPEQIATGWGCAAFDLGERRYRYDRWGLAVGGG